MIEWTKIAPKLGDWAENFKPFWEAGGFDLIYNKLKLDAAKDKVLPKSTDLFKCFELCPKKDLRCIIIGSEPYIEDVNDGLAFSATTMTPTLEKIWRGIEIDISEGLDLSKIHFENLAPWAKKGVLLLNSSLSVLEGKTLSHIQLWVPFMEYFLKSIEGISGIPIVLVGKQAQTYAYLINEKVHFLKQVEHPLKAINKDWECDKMFSWINNILKQNNNEQIDWYDLPF